jgi:uncharacterized damage-inducible protein DinB
LNDAPGHTGAFFLSDHVMTTTSHFAQLATYNEWMNRKLYGAAAALPAERLHEDRGAFFGSVFGTLNHLVIADLIWFKRIAANLPGFASLQCVDDLPRPTSLDHRLCATLSELDALRIQLDAAINAFCAEVQPSQLEGALTWTSMKGVANRKRLGDVLLHVFNHQTHHRGQATTLFSQLGVDVGPTDLLLLLPDTD